jgi:hypothetical protein
MRSMSMPAILPTSRSVRLPKFLFMNVSNPQIEKIPGKRSDGFEPLDQHVTDQRKKAKAPSSPYRLEVEVSACMNALKILPFASSGIPTPVSRTSTCSNTLSMPGCKYDGSSALAVGEHNPVLDSACSSKALASSDDVASSSATRTLTSMTPLQK